MRKDILTAPQQEFEMRNIGKVSKQWLAEIGVYTVDDIRKKGVVEAYLAVKKKFPKRVSLNMLWALQGAATDVHWKDIPRKTKEELLREVAKRAQKSSWTALKTFLRSAQAASARLMLSW
jgi:hypothetical protein